MKYPNLVFLLNLLLLLLLSLLLLLLLLLLFPSFCPDEFSELTSGRIFLKFGDMVDMNVKLSKKDLNFKMSNS